MSEVEHEDASGRRESPAGERLGRGPGEEAHGEEAKESSLEQPPER